MTLSLLDQDLERIRKEREQTKRVLAMLCGGPKVCRATFEAEIGIFLKRVRRQCGPVES